MSCVEVRMWSTTKPQNDKNDTLVGGKVESSHQPVRHRRLVSHDDANDSTENAPIQEHDNIKPDVEIQPDTKK